MLSWLSGELIHTEEISAQSMARSAFAAKPQPRAQPMKSSIIFKAPFAR